VDKPAGEGPRYGTGHQGFWWGSVLWWWVVFLGLEGVSRIPRHRLGGAFSRRVPGSPVADHCGYGSFVAPRLQPESRAIHLLVIMRCVQVLGAVGDFRDITAERAEEESQERRGDGLLSWIEQASQCGLPQAIARGWAEDLRSDR